MNHEPVLEQAQNDRDNLYAQMEGQVEGIASLREELAEYAAECYRLRQMPAGAGGFPVRAAPALRPELASQSVQSGKMISFQPLSPTMEHSLFQVSSL